MLAVGRKEFRQIARDRRSLMVLLFVPAFFLLLYGYALSFDVQNIQLAVLDHDRSQASRELVNAFVKSGYFELIADVSSSREYEELIDRRRCARGPRHSGRPPARSADRAPRAGAGHHQRRQLEHRDDRDGIRARESCRPPRRSISFRAPRERRAPLITVESRVWYNPQLRSALFLIPGLIAYIGMISAVVSTSLSVVREKERGTMEQVRMAPLGTGAYIVGKTLPYFVISLATSVFIVLASMPLFGLPMHGSWLLLLLALSLYLAGALGLGLMISTVAESQQVAFQLAVLASFLPTMMLSGFVFPIASMPAPIQAITFLVPARYFIVALRAIVLKGADVSTFWVELVALAVYAALMLTLASRACAGNGRSRRILFVMWKEMLELRQDPRIFGVIFVAPVLQLAILGYAATTDVRNVPIVIVDADRSSGEPGPDQPVHRLGHLRARRRRVGRAGCRSVSRDRRRLDGADDSGAIRREPGGRSLVDAAGRRRRIGRELDEHRDGVRDEPHRRLHAGARGAARARARRADRRRRRHRAARAHLVQPDASRAGISCCPGFSRCSC